MDYDSLLELVKKRRSTYGYKPDDVSDELLDKDSIRKEQDVRDFIDRLWKK